MVRVAIPYLIPISLSPVLVASVFLSAMLKQLKVDVRTAADAAFYILLFIGIFYYFLFNFSVSIQLSLFSASRVCFFGC